MKDFRNRSDLPLGLRNNNPGNVRPVPGGWQGQVGVNRGFAVFPNVVLGIRAMAMDLLKDYYIDRQQTLQSLISEYAPPSENKTSSYVAAVSRLLNFPANTVYPMNRGTLKRLLVAMCTVEIGAVQVRRHLSEEDFNQAINMVSSRYRQLLGIARGAAGVGVLVLMLGVSWAIFGK